MSRRQRYRLEEERVGLMRRIIDTATLVRSYWSGPITSNSPEIARLWAAPASSTGIGVSEETALAYSAVWAAVNLIASDVATLPLIHYKRTQDGGKERYTGANGSSLYTILHDRPNPEMTSLVWRKTVQAHALTWGNGYSEIVRDNANRVSALWPITPDRVTPFRRGVDTPLQYRVTNPSGSETIFDGADIVHIPGLGWDGTCGYSVIRKARESVGLGVAAERFGGTFFGNGATFGGAISYPGARPTELSEKNYRENLEAKHQGVDRAHKLLALYNGATYTRMGIPPNDAQFLETRQFQIAEIARWFNVPPHKIGDLTRATFSNIEQQTIDYYTTTLVQWLTTWEQELNSKLIPRLEQNLQFVEHVVDGLMRGDAQSRGEYQSKQFSVGAVTINEMRTAENRNKIKGGDRAFVPLNMIALDKYDEWIDAEIEAKKTPKPSPAPAPAAPADPNQKTGREEALETELALARRKAQEAEDAKDRANALLTERAVDLLREQDARRSDGVAKDAEIVRVTAQAASLGTDLGRATGDLAAVTAARDLALQAVEDAGRAGVTLSDERDQALTRATKAEEDHRFEAQARQQAAVRELDLQARLDGAEAARVTAAMIADADRAAAAAALATVTEERDDAIRRYGDGQTHIARLEAEFGSLVVEHRALTARAETADAVIAELRIQNLALQAGVDTAQAGIVEAREAIARAETRLTDAEAARATLMTSAMAAEAEAEKSERRIAAARDALKGVLIDTIGRQLQRESDRARKAQASPEKLRSWMRTFYPVQDEYFRTSVRPAVRALLACVGHETRIDAVLDEFVAEFLEHSQRQLTLVAAETDVETLAPALEKVLRRWDTDRAEQAADALLRKVA